MGVIGDVPSYAVADRAPTLSRVVGNFNTTDYRDILLFPAISGGLGYVAGGTAGAKVCMRTPTAVCAGGLGLVAGLMFAAQSSSARLMGFRNPE